MCLVFSYLLWCLLSRVLKAWTDLSSSQEGQSKRRKSFQCIISTSLDTVYWLCIVLHHFLWGFLPMYYLFSAFVLLSPFLLPHPFQHGANYLPLIFENHKEREKCCPSSVHNLRSSPSWRHQKPLTYCGSTGNTRYVHSVDAHLVLPLTALNISSGWTWWQ